MPWAAPVTMATLPEFMTSFLLMLEKSRVYTPPAAALWPPVRAVLQPQPSSARALTQDL
jgi:hypothetical protein